MVTFFTCENFNATVFKIAMKHYRGFGYDAQSQRLLTILGYFAGHARALNSNQRGGLLISVSQRCLLCQM